MRFGLCLLSAAVGLLLADPGSGAAQDLAEAYLRIKVPTEKTRLEIQGVVTKQEGQFRIFKSPPLQTGRKYSYDAKITWTVDGVTLTRERSIIISGGERYEIDFTVDAAPPPAPKDPVKPVDPMPNPKDPPKPVDPMPKPKDPPKPVDPMPKPKDPPKPVDPMPKPKDPPKPVDPMPKPKDPPKPVDPMPKPKDPPKPVDPMPKPKDPPKPLKLDAPNVATPMPIVEKMLEMAKVKEGDVVYDLGSGDGRIVIAAVEKFQASRAVGIEMDPVHVAKSQQEVVRKKLEGKVVIREGDFMQLQPKDLADATVVMLYLLPKTNEALKSSLLEKLKPGTRIVSHDYDIFGWKEEARVDVKVGDFDHSVYLYIVK